MSFFRTCLRGPVFRRLGESGAWDLCGTKQVRDEAIIGSSSGMAVPFFSKFQPDHGSVMIRYDKFGAATPQVFVSDHFSWESFWCDLLRDSDEVLRSNWELRPLSEKQAGQMDAPESSAGSFC